MKAIVRERYGSPDVLRLADVANPTISDDELLVRVRAASLNAADWHLVRGSPFVVRLTEGLRRPKNKGVGIDAAGVVEEVGRNVTHVQPGDDVYGTLADVGGGACAEFASGRRFVLKPVNLNFEEAAAVPVAAITALQAIRDKAKVRGGQTAAVYGAGGGVGTFAVQIAKAFGAEVTAITSGDKTELVRSLGADHVRDYTQDDFTTGGPRYDTIIDVSGTEALSSLRRALVPGGRLVLVGAGSGPGGPIGRVATAAARSLVLRQRIIPFLSKETNEDLLALKELIEAGKATPVIDCTYPLGETAAALAYLESGRAAGKIVITI